MKDVHKSKKTNIQIMKKDNLQIKSTHDGSRSVVNCLAIATGFAIMPRHGMTTAVTVTTASSVYSWDALTMDRSEPKSKVCTIVSVWVMYRSCQFTKTFKCVSVHELERKDPQTKPHWRSVNDPAIIVTSDNCIRSWEEGSWLVASKSSNGASDGRRMSRAKRDSSSSIVGPKDNNGVPASSSEARSGDSIASFVCVWISVVDGVVLGTYGYDSTAAQSHVP